MRKKQISIVLLLVMALVMASPMIGGVQASPTTIIEILPETTLVGIEENFNVSINILDAIDLYGFQFVLRYDPNVLNAVAVDIVNGSATIDQELTGDPVWDGYNCDVLEDGVLDVYDFFAFAAAYPSVEGQPRYNPRADFDGDGDVDHYDFGIFASAWRTVGMPGAIQFYRLDAYEAWEGGILANVTFKAISSGKTVLGLDSVKLSTDMWEPIPYETRNGTVQVGHDVATINVTPSKTVVGQNYSMFINATVENQGAYTETFNVTAYYGNATITSQQWETFWSMGDVNRNGTIDMGDYELLNASYPSTLGDPKYCPWADLDSDGDVDRYDAGKWASNYGLEIWTYFISGGVIETQPVNNLSPGSFSILTLMWNTTGVPFGNYTINAYAVPIFFGENYRANNNYGDGIVLVSVVCDICGDPDDPHPDPRMNPPDGDVDRYDFGVFARVYGLSIGDPEYMPEADFVGDSLDPNPNIPDHDVDRYDYGIFAQNYGATVLP